MKQQLSLETDELRIIGHSLTWWMNTPAAENRLPPLNEAEILLLSRLFDDICALNRRALADGGRVLITIEIPDCLAENRLQLSPHDLSLMTDAVKFFSMALQATPTELTVLTGLPESASSDLLKKMEATNRARPVQ